MTAMSSAFSRFGRLLASDALMSKVLMVIALTPLAVIGSIVAILAYNTAEFSSKVDLIQMLSCSQWLPEEGVFGFLPFIAGTAWVTVTAMVIALPLGLLTAIFIAEYLPRRAYGFVKGLVELLAAIPSVVYGLWGITTIVPIVKEHVAPLLSKVLGWIPIFQVNVNLGYSVLAAGFVLAIMVLPILISISEDAISSVPRELKEASFSLGATKLQTIRKVVLRVSMPGIIVAVILSFCRAFGETMAVLMVAGNVAKVPSTLFDPAYPLTALIANSLGEMFSDPLYVSALATAGFILFTITFTFNVVARLLVRRIVRRRGLT
ncbi:MAG: phosphate ABC transporter permease subunit PstC [Thermoprotei archaeon]|mgnify:CR=1 FL=1|nr:MAG: phosphate ABC transporter permease subunit PstC [Thermoprotei archaeon]